MALDGIQGIYPKCLSVPQEGGTVKHLGNFPVYRLKPCGNLFVARETPMKSLSCFAS